MIRRRVLSAGPLMLAALVIAGCGPEAKTDLPATGESSSGVEAKSAAEGETVSASEAYELSCVSWSPRDAVMFLVEGGDGSDVDRIKTALDSMSIAAELDPRYKDEFDQIELFAEGVGAWTALMNADAGATQIMDAVGEIEIPTYECPPRDPDSSGLPLPDDFTLQN